MQALRHKRPWIKVQLSVNGAAEEAAALVKSWKTQRQAAACIVLRSVCMRRCAGGISACSEPISRACG
jgi:hypothetical protein